MVPAQNVFREAARRASFAKALTAAGGAASAHLGGIKVGGAVAIGITDTAATFGHGSFLARFCAVVPTTAAVGWPMRFIRR